ncbi:MULTISPECIES: bifunctional diaminohydroxyphosphoribosylaminopyrimidine deaminase/5-amino-6-(5-phosphoribosylamino)uracil reductase RibD [Brucella/Ochrobactrum group]|uniref:bifunctional diaminohydroxyphosphoribosylaminopyrimidine deaminase/5-amino-6-(5-phosphoribosylamino)uracil reductase RibD n=1 Tax=Brucella/Ochrobactrum group TaxID=2826938 RepID=UPI0004ED9889|nr:MULTISPECIES: bifunctional diaminohydroxyphosphoribosylaminopyrimidine deaminase/5-amino-6-(5-phosphoribosylamino)uracil reductase RibD [Brucella/Ochrobactrum group]AIK44751.1 riboflavin biosynthesis protein RibD [Brucella anthropi]KAB2746658.1 bifunctional diaminohydroxyphosphoribosylaminopyrimidine deaminase/5-amino-6-(5-phosphoribosylamino)uracil reductase RibD [Brucella anthropi]MCQ9147074.1 bifunctional diaminohydroxyphosphoribosylaminopyrimidine deaminase/5-amino-6-(5-phosphoribosylamin
MSGSKFPPSNATADDVRFMEATIRYARRHKGLTGTNPSVGTIIVKDGVIVGRGVTAIGGRPHAEPQALADAGEAARGATAYVTLEPCAHHGRTPPCAEALVRAGVARVVVAATDPDERVSGRGFAILREAGIEVVPGILAEQAADDLAGYLNRSAKKRPEVILKLALSADGMIGRRGEGQLAITGSVARAQSHILRAQTDIILIGIETALADDPVLNCRLPGLEQRSPVRVVLDSGLRLPLSSKLVQTADAQPLWIACGEEALPERRYELQAAGCRILATEAYDCRIALPELMDDLAAQGISSVLVEGGAGVAKSFLDEGLVDRLAIFRSPVEIGSEFGVAVDGLETHIADKFKILRQARYGDDAYAEYVSARM